MSHSDAMRNIYFYRLGEHLKKELIKKNISKNEIAFDDFDDITYINETTVSEILKGRRNMSYNSAIAFQATLDYQNPKQLFFPDTEFCIKLVSDILHLIISDDLFRNSLLRETLMKHLNCEKDSQEKAIEIFIMRNKNSILSSLLNFYPDFPREMTSKDISESLICWLSELACLISHLEK